MLLCNTMKMYPFVTYLVETFYIYIYIYISAKMLYIIVLNYIYAFAKVIYYYYYFDNSIIKGERFES